MKARYYFILLTSAVAGATLASAEEVNVRWLRQPAGDSAYVHESRAQKLADLLGRVKVLVNTESATQHSAEPVLHENVETNVVSQKSRVCRSSIQKERRAAAKFEANRPPVLAGRRTFVNVIVGRTTGVDGKQFSTATQKPSTATQKATATQKPNYVGRQRRPIQR